MFRCDRKCDRYDEKFGNFARTKHTLYNKIDDPTHCPDGVWSRAFTRRALCSLISTVIHIYGLAAFIISFTVSAAKCTTSTPKAQC